MLRKHDLRVVVMTEEQADKLAASLNEMHVEPFVPIEWCVQNAPVDWGIPKVEKGDNRFPEAMIGEELNRDILIAEPDLVSKNTPGWAVAYNEGTWISHEPYPSDEECGPREGIDTV